MNSPTGPAATAGRLMAVAGLTFTEAIRRKIFLVVILVGIAIVSSAAFFPSIDASGKLRLIEVWSIRTVTIFCSLGAIFLAGFSLPGDFEQRRVYTLVTKPIHKGTLFLGKFLGFLALMSVFLLIMGVLTLIYIRVVAWSTPGFPALVAYPQHFADEFTGERHMMDPKGASLAAKEDMGGKLIWKFTIPPDRFDDTVSAKIKLDLGKGDSYALQGEAMLRAVNVAKGVAWEEKVTVQTNRAYAFQFPSKGIVDSGAFQIEIQPLDAGLTMASRPNGLKLRTRSANFDLNFLVGMGLILLQSTLVLLITLAASTAVSSPVSILLGIFLFFVGSGWSFVKESLGDVDSALAEVKRHAAEGDRKAARTPEDLPPWMLEVSSVVSKGVLAVVPNFEDYNFSEWVLADHAIQADDLARGAKSFAPLALVLLACGLIGMKVRDFAT